MSNFFTAGKAEQHGTGSIVNKPGGAGRASGKTKSVGKTTDGGTGGNGREAELVRPGKEAPDRPGKWRSNGRRGEPDPAPLGAQNYLPGPLAGGEIHQPEDRLAP